MNMRNVLFLLMAVLMIACGGREKQAVLSIDFNIIPKPNSINFHPQYKQSDDTYFNFPGSFSVRTNDTDFSELPEFAKSLLNTNATENEKSGLLVLRKLNMEIPQEAYRLQVFPDSIVISATTGSGIFYGLQTLAQILEDAPQAPFGIPLFEINDWPRFGYRGMHLDVCRHFYTVDFVKHYLDLMARYKLNTFHWHLTEDQGWRIEIKKYPKLTEIGAWRTELDTTTGDTVRYGGFYTQEQIRDVVQYAKERFITIIPEIEMPGHSRAALAAYPQFSCSGEYEPVANRWGVFTHVYCAGNDSTFYFLQDVLDEVIDMFPGTYIHIGGDECPKKAWEECPKCQARIKAEKLADENELQSYFIRRIEQYLISKNRKLIGWDEILEGGLAPEATVMSWRGIKGGIAAAKQQHDVIMTPGTHCYFDHYQANPEYEPHAIGGYTTVQKVYSYEPVPDVLNNEEARFILGAQANMWTEYIATEHHLEYMLLPRMLALAEVDWTEPKHKNWDDFNRRLQAHFRYFDKQGINYCPGDYTIHFKLIPNPEGGDSLLQMETEIYQAEIRYTTDGTEPTARSQVYNGPIALPDGISISASIFENGKPVHGFSLFKRK
jgi:hexosaminidase